MSTGKSAPVSQDTVFDILSNARRRYVLYYLRKAEEPVELSDLARELAAWENETGPEDLTDQQQKRVYVSLYQTHIQKLADAGMVDYDKDTGLVSLAEGAEELRGYLGQESEPADPMQWQRWYVLIAVAGGALYALVALDVPIFGLLPELLAGLAILVAFSALTAAHYIHSMRRSSGIPADSLIRDER
jgi:DNA-binding transcriptional ArsR family regulator